MTFRELFEKAMYQVDTTANYAGRTEAMYAFRNKLNELIQPLVEQSEWESCYVGVPYARGADPYISLHIFGAKAIIDFKIKLKKAGKKHSYYGDTTYYVPSVAFTCDEQIMLQDVVTYLDFLYNTNDGVKEAIARQINQEETITKYKPLLDSITAVVNEFNELPADVRSTLRAANLPTVNYWDY